jgi:hypothetical protein
MGGFLGGLAGGYADTAEKRKSSGQPSLLSKFRNRGKKSDPALPPGYKRGGKVRKTGMAKVHKGERVLTAKQDRKMKKRMGRKRR